MDMSRVENILRYILGEEATLPVPLSRVEELLIELGRMIEEGKLVNPIVIKGRVDTLEDLYAVQNPEPGWLYFVGLETDTNLDEYVYSVENTWDRVGTSTIAVDSALSTESENPVQNKVITAALNGKAASTDIKDGTLTITANGNTYTFSANSATNVTLDLGNIQSLIDAQHMLSADLVDDTNSTNKFVTAADKEKIDSFDSSIAAAFVYRGSVDNVDLLPASSNRNGDVYNVAYSYSVTVEEPADWSTNYTSYYTKSGNTYTEVTGGSAPTWAAYTYYARSNNGGDYVWIGSSWDAMSGEFAIEPITNTEIDAMFS